MLSRKVIATHITNLTDARYFAAWGVDYLMFDLDPDSPHYISTNDVLEIKEWVEGPKIIVHNATAESIDRINPDGIVLDNAYRDNTTEVELEFRKVVANDIALGLPQGNYLINEGGEALSNITDDGSDYYVDFASIEIEQLNSYPHLGLQVRGGAEEKVGVKTFDDLDELFDLLMG